MKDKKTIITVHVKSPTILDQEKMEKLQATIYDEIVEPFGCERRVSYAQNKVVAKVLSFYIFKEGRFKNSVKLRLEKTLQKLNRYWPPMAGYSIDVLDAEKVDI